MLIELIRKQIQTCGKSRYRISQDTGIEEAALCRIMQGKTCTVETADILLKYFGLKLASDKKHKTNERKAK
jgi:plasmid maintenance system antidote protein VapI